MQTAYQAGRAYAFSKLSGVVGSTAKKALKQVHKPLHFAGHQTAHRQAHHALLPGEKTGSEGPGVGARIAGGLGGAMAGGLGGAVAGHQLSEEPHPYYGKPGALGALLGMPSYARARQTRDNNMATGAGLGATAGAVGGALAPTVGTTMGGAALGGLGGSLGAGILADNLDSDYTKEIAAGGGLLGALGGAYGGYRLGKGLS